MGNDNRKPLPFPANTPRITREQFYYETARMEAIRFAEAGEVAAARKRKPEAKESARANPPPKEWRDDEAREILDMFKTEEDFQYSDAARRYVSR